MTAWKIERLPATGFEDYRILLDGDPVCRYSFDRQELLELYQELDNVLFPAPMDGRRDTISWRMAVQAFDATGRPLDHIGPPVPADASSTSKEDV